MTREIRFVTRRLGELVTHRRQTIKPDDMMPDMAYVVMENINSGDGTFSYLNTSAESIASTKTVFQEGDVLFGKLRPNLRKVVVVDRGGYCSTDILPLTPTNNGTAYLLANLLRGDAFAREVERVISGASLPRVGVKDLLQLTVRWPEEPSAVTHLEGMAKRVHGLRVLTKNASQLALDLDRVLIGE